MNSYISAFVCVLVVVIGQLIMKAVGLRIHSIHDLITNWRIAGLFALALVLYAMSTLLWVDVLRTLPLSRAYMVMSSAVVLVPFASALIFGEVINFRLLLGIGLVIVGIIVSNYN